MIIQAIIRLPYASIKELSEQCSVKFQTYLINQHDADEKVKTTHCHLLIDISGHFTTTDALSKWMKGRENGEKLNRQTMNLLRECQDSKKPYDRLLLARYILKGHQPLQQTGFTEAEIIGLIGSWQLQADITEEDSEQLAAPKPSKETKKSCYKVLIEMLEEPDALFGRREGSEDFYTYDTKPKTLRVSPEDLMRIVIRVLKRNEMTPHPQQIDRFVGSMYNMVEDANHNEYQHCSISRYTAYKFSQS